jgi:hypothetical protein
MKIIIIFLAILGGIQIIKYIVWPILESIIYGHICHLLTLLNINWRKTKWTPRAIACVLFGQWRQSLERLGGRDTYTSEIQQGNWRYRPPFSLKKIKNSK